MKVVVALAVLAAFGAGFLSGRCTSCRAAAAGEERFSAQDARVVPPEPLAACAHELEAEPARREPAFAAPPAPAPSPSIPRSKDEAYAELERILRDGMPRDAAGFADKYRAASTGELWLAHSLFEQRVNAERQRLVEACLRDGPYEERVVRPGETVPPLASTSDGRPVSFGGEFGAPVDGGTMTRSVVLGAEHFPEFAALQDEWWWLSMELRRRSAEQIPSAPRARSR